jgi:hypothetical protein
MLKGYGQDKFYNQPDKGVKKREDMGLLASQK